MSKHTPGPWAFAKTEDNYPFEGRYSIVEKDGAPYTPEPSDVADIENSASPDVQLANARLIAAAPEMLDYLQTVLQDFSPYIEDEHDDEIRERNERTLNDIRALIAKATGGEE